MKHTLVRAVSQGRCSVCSKLRSLGLYFQALKPGQRLHTSLCVFHEICEVNAAEGNTSVKCTMLHLQIQEVIWNSWMTLKVSPFPWESVQTLFNITICRPLLCSFCVCQDMWLEICWLCKPFIARIKGADIGSITGMDANMSTKIKVQWKSLPTTFKGALEWFFSCMNKLMSL